MTIKKRQYADDDTSSIKSLALMRAPSLALGLLFGALLSFITSRFEVVLTHNVEVAYFIPFIVYVADAVGTQTQSIYIRDLRSGKANFHKYLFKETILGLIFGSLFGLTVALVALWWFGSTELALATSLATLISITTAPLVAVLVSHAFEIEHTDPAVGAGPLTTVIQDTLSVLIYGSIATFILV